MSGFVKLIFVSEEKGEVGLIIEQPCERNLVLSIPARELRLAAQKAEKGTMTGVIYAIAYEDREIE